MLIHAIRHNFPTNADYNISRAGLDRFCFFHFSAPTSIRLGDQLIRTRPNACILYSPGQPRQVTNYQPSLMNWVHLGTQVEPLLTRYAIPLDRVFYPNDASFIPSILRQMEIEHYTNDPYSQTLIGGYVEEFFIKLSRSVHSDKKQPGISRKEQLRLHRVRELVLLHPEKKWTVAEMASLAALSTSRFHSAYRALFGTTPIRDVMEAKMDYAKTLLLSDPALSIQDIADRLSYKSPYYFITQFKELTGSSPGAYRKNNKIQ